MTEQEAGEVITLIQAATGDARVGQQTLDYFGAALLELDYNAALSAAATGVSLWRRFPSWSEFREFYKAQARLAEPAGEQREQVETRSPKHPEWVWVWSWARTQRAPRNLRAFPQQREFVDPDLVMSEDEYRELREEWLQAGSPKAKTPIPLAR